MLLGSVCPRGGCPRLSYHMRTHTHIKTTTNVPWCIYILYFSLVAHFKRHLHMHNLFNIVHTHSHFFNHVDMNAKWNRVYYTLSESSHPCIIEYSASTLHICNCKYVQHKGIHLSKWNSNFPSSIPPSRIVFFLQVHFIITLTCIVHLPLVATAVATATMTSLQ